MLGGAPLRAEYPPPAPQTPLPPHVSPLYRPPRLRPGSAPATVGNGRYGRVYQPIANGTGLAWAGLGILLFSVVSCAAPRPRGDPVRCPVVGWGGWLALCAASLFFFVVVGLRPAAVAPGGALWLLVFVVPGLCRLSPRQVVLSLASLVLLSRLAVPSRSAARSGLTRRCFLPPPRLVPSPFGGLAPRSPSLPPLGRAVLALGAARPSPSFRLSLLAFGALASARLLRPPRRCAGGRVGLPPPRCGRGCAVARWLWCRRLPRRLALASSPSSPVGLPPLAGRGWRFAPLPLPVCRLSSFRSAALPPLSLASPSALVAPGRWLVVVFGRLAFVGLSGSVLSVARRFGVGLFLFKEISHVISSF